jgi:hypothetical protein
MQKTHELGFIVQEASADKAYSSRDNMNLVDKMGVFHISHSSPTARESREGTATSGERCMRCSC